MLFLFVLLLVAIHGTLDAPLHRHLAQRTDIQCETTEECLSQLSSNWCDRAVYCDVGFCYKIPHYPCEQGQFCNPVVKQCSLRTCVDWRDCDDGLFCTGREKCIRGQCVRDPLRSPDCSHGICSENHRKCHTPLSLVNESARVRLHSYNMIHQSGNGVHSLDNHTNTTAPTTAPTEPLNQSLMLTIIIAIAIVVFVVLFIIAIIGNTYKPMNALTVIDVTTAPGDGDVYDVETFYGNH